MFVYKDIVEWIILVVVKNFFFIPVLLLSIQSLAQIPESADSLKNFATKVFVDCQYCDMEYFRREIEFVNYVRERKDAGVFILITQQNTGSGGTEYTLTFLGQHEFAGKNDTLHYVSATDETYDETREGIAQIMKIGLVPYISRTPFANLVNISYNLTDNENMQVEDKWKYWVFAINANAYTNGEEANNHTYFNSSVNIDKVTDKIKFETFVRLNYNESNYKINDTTNYKSITKSQTFNNLIVKSITDHWSAGISTYANSSTYSNIDMSITVSPAVEYNIFKYSESTRKQLRILYKFGTVFSNYVDTTIYNVLNEKLLFESLRIAFSIKEKWGSVSTSLNGSHYFHDFDLNNINLWTNVRLRIIKGLSFNLNSYLSLIHDQISLPKQGASPEEILLQRRILETQYSYYASVGFTYTFGSLYNNIVNPRFGN